MFFYLQLFAGCSLLAFCTTMLLKMPKFPTGVVKAVLVVKRRWSMWVLYSIGWAIGASILIGVLMRGA